MPPNNVKPVKCCKAKKCVVDTPMLTKPDRNVPPPKRPMISANLRQLKKGESVFLEGVSPASVQPIVTRLKKESKGAANFTSEWQGTGIRVWRTA